MGDIEVWLSIYSVINNMAVLCGGAVQCGGSMETGVDAPLVNNHGQSNKSALSAFRPDMLRYTTAFLPIAFFFLSRPSIHPSIHPSTHSLLGRSRAPFRFLQVPKMLSTRILKSSVPRYCLRAAAGQSVSVGPIPRYSRERRMDEVWLTTTPQRKESTVFRDSK